MIQFFISKEDNQLYIGVPTSLNQLQYDLFLYEELLKLRKLRKLETFFIGYYPKQKTIPVKANINLTKDLNNYTNIGFCSNSRLIFYKQAIDYIDQKQKLINMFSSIYETNLSWIFLKKYRKRVKDFRLAVSTLNKLIDLKLNSDIIMKIVRQFFTIYDTKYFKFIGTRMKEYVKNNDLKFHIPKNYDECSYILPNTFPSDEWIISFCRLYKERGIEPFTFYNFNFE